jgi:glycosyltransferase involved in cell wall biosynthesis
MRAPSSTNEIPEHRNDGCTAGKATRLRWYPADSVEGRTPRIGIIVVAYNAATTLAQVLDRIPRSFVPQIADVLVADDASQDSTFLVGLGYQQVKSDLPITLIRREKNLGYGGNQKAAYRWAIDHDLDIVVLLHGDGQYAPEHLPKMVEPIVDDTCDVVLGSRMMEKGAARRGGMPLYKFVGNRILTTAQNKLAGADLTEWHSGYRAYRVAALDDVPFEENHDGFDFDTQIILQMLEAGKRITEIPIPTYYGDEICYVAGMTYARDVMRDTIRYRAHKIGFGEGDAAFASTEYDVKEGALSSHGRIAAWLAHRKPARILDLGCSGGQLAAALRKQGHHVTGVDVIEIDGVRDRLDEFILHDLDHGLPAEVGGPFDIVIAADVLEHVREPEQLLAEARSRLSPDGMALACVPNFGHWYPRARVASGTFSYERRGILDAGHVRFFTRRTFNRMIHDAGFEVSRQTAIGLPFEVLARGSASGAATVTRVFATIDRVMVATWPTMFAYQFLSELRPA